MELSNESQESSWITRSLSASWRWISRTSVAVLHGFQRVGERVVDFFGITGPRYWDVEVIGYSQNKPEPEDTADEELTRRYLRGEFFETSAEEAPYVEDTNLTVLNQSSNPGPAEIQSDNTPPQTEQP
ncbi:hypothetical protein BLNAU_12884 [Blattamonas nauphoetae]|uniref:Uncharacterized protein n=1 Tax=Blattamonas nauphoetae TaxID=2049346 RepID=A0ABQ9XPP0_9EUKA|nr:hypothetical protein BLNAU_12884 [Blattamonas nauphoetae]